MPSDRMRRRDFEKLGLGLGLGALGGCPSQQTATAPAETPDLGCAAGDDDAFDYVVVGSGAGGGPVACNLARAGHRVALLEAGGDPDSFARRVPALHAVAVEEPELRWDFYARTYTDFGLQRDNEKFDAARGGVLYPRAGALGGCTTHHALITLCPHESDWDAIAEACGDPSFRGVAMRRYFERLERCQYASIGGAARHGGAGWLPTDVASPWLASRDGQLLSIIEAAAEEAAELDPTLIADAIGSAIDPGRALFDPNDYRAVRACEEGLYFVPLSTSRGERVGTREHVRSVAAACPGRLVPILNALVTRVLFEDGNRAVGVEYLPGARLYGAAAGADPASPGHSAHVARSSSLAESSTRLSS